MAKTFDGQLNVNIVFKSLYNQIINIYTNSKNVSNTFQKLLEAHRREGSLYGDTIVRIETYPLPIHTWKNYEEASNLLEVDKPQNPKPEKITLDQFKQLRLTLDEYASKQSFADPTGFSQFQSVCQQWLGDSKRIYESQTFNAFIGTMKSERGGAQDVSVTVPDVDSETGAANKEAAMRMKTTAIANKLADILIDLQTFGTDYNDGEFPRSYDPSDLQVVWNANIYNQLLKAGLPAFFKDNAGLIDNFGQYVLPAKFFGDIQTSGGTTDGTNSTNIYAMYEKDYTTTSGTVHVRAGEKLPANCTYDANEGYIPDPTVICKIIHKDDAVWMGGFSVQTNFWNARALLTTYFSTFMHNTLEHFSGLPCVTMKEVTA